MKNAIVAIMTLSLVAPWCFGDSKSPAIPKLEDVKVNGLTLGMPFSGALKRLKHKSLSDIVDAGVRIISFQSKFAGKKCLLQLEFFQDRLATISIKSYPNSGYTLKDINAVISDLEGKFGESRSYSVENDSPADTGYFYYWLENNAPQTGYSVAMEYYKSFDGSISLLISYTHYNLHELTITSAGKSD